MTWPYIGRQFLRVITLGLAVTAFCRMPATTKVSVIFSPRVPTGLDAVQIEVLQEPTRRFEVVTKGGSVISSGQAQPLFGWTRERIRPKEVALDRILVVTRNPLISFGARRVSELMFQLDGGALIASDLTFSLEEGSDLGRAGSWDGRGERVRLHRSGCGRAEAGSELRLVNGWDRTPSIYAGADSTVTFDTSELPFLVQATQWPQFTSSAQPCYGSFDFSRAPFAALQGERVPREGIDLAYDVEDELAGPYRTPPPVQITARVVDTKSVQKLSEPCRQWRGSLSRACWREFGVLTSAACAPAWPVLHDAGRRVLHLSYSGTPEVECALVVGADAPQHDAVHAMVIKLLPISKPAIAPPATAR